MFFPVISTIYKTLYDTFILSIDLFPKDDVYWYGISSLQMPGTVHLGYHSQNLYLNKSVILIEVLQEQIHYPSAVIQFYLLSNQV